MNRSVQTLFVVASFVALMILLTLIYGNHVDIFSIITYTFQRFNLSTSLLHGSKLKLFNPASNQCLKMYALQKDKMHRLLRQNSTNTTPFWTKNHSQSTSPLYVYICLPSRLGNTIFPYAAAIGVALRNNRTPLIAKKMFKQLNETFITHAPVLDDDSEYKANGISMTERHYRYYMQETENLPSGKNVSLQWYLQSRLYFMNAEEELRKELTFRKSVLDVVSAKLKNLTASAYMRNRTTFGARVAIHIRRGDIANSSGWILPKRDYFDRAMNYFRQCYDHVLFIVLSEDVTWCKMNVVGQDVVYSEGLSAGEDMALASLCDHVIMSHGTYSVWCAWFANGLTVRPLIYMSNSSEFERTANPDHYLPPNTIVV